MNVEMKKANLLAENINGFIQFVFEKRENRNNYSINHDKVHQIKLLIEEFKFQILADELLRINQYSWEEKYTHFLVDRFREGINVIDEYVNNNYNDLFIFTAKLYTLKNLSLSFSKKE